MNELETCIRELENANDIKTTIKIHKKGKKLIRKYEKNINGGVFDVELFDMSLRKIVRKLDEIEKNIDDDIDLDTCYKLLGETNGLSNLFEKKIGEYKMHINFEKN